MPATVIHSLFIFLVVFSCLFYGSVTSFPQAVIEITCGALVLIWLLDMSLRRKFVFLKTGLYWALGGLVLVVIVQLLPLPEAIIKVISPQAWNYHQRLIPSGYAGSFLAASINPDATAGEMLKLLAYTGLFLVVIHSIETKKQFSLLINALIILGVGISLFGIIQKYGSPERIYWFDPSAAPNTAFGPFINRNNFSGYINMIIPLTLGYCLTNMQLSRRIVYYSCLGVMCLGLFLSSSRGGIIVFCLGLFLFVVLSKCKDSLRSRKASLLIAFFVAVALLVFLLESKMVLARLATLYQKEALFVFGHGYSWLDIIRIWRDFPLLGTGLGTFGFLSSMYKSSFAQSLFTYAHNDALQLLSEVGAVGTFLTVSFFFLFLRTVINEWRQRHSNYAVAVILGGLVSVCITVIYSFLDFNLHVPANAVLLFFIMGLIYRLAFNRFKDELAVSG